MAGDEAATAQPQAPPPPPPPRTAAAESALPAAADAVAVGFLCSVWMTSAANAVFVAAHWLYGGDSSIAALTKDFALLSSVLMGLLLHASFLMMLSMRWRRGSFRGEAREIGGGGATERHVFLRALKHAASKIDSLSPLFCSSSCCS